MTSLNAFLPVLSDLWGVSPGVLYERQRSMVHLGLMKSRPGRGPGSGVTLTPENVARLLVAYAGVDSLAVVYRSKKVFAANANEYTPDFACPVTGKNTFLDILTETLTRPALAARIVSFEIDLNGPAILVSYFAGRGGAPKHYELFIDEKSSRSKGVMKRSIIRGVDRISAALEPLRDTSDKPD